MDAPTVKTVLPNGVRLVSQHMPHTRSVAMGVWVNVGARDEADVESGLSHLIEHMIFKGTGPRTAIQIAKELDAIGGLSNAFTSSEYTCFHSRVLDKHLPTLIEILSDIFLNSVFDPTELDREKQVILQEISMLEDTPDEHIHVLFSRQLLEEPPLGMSVLGHAGDRVRDSSVTGSSGSIPTALPPRAILLVAAGNLDHEELVRHLRPFFGSTLRTRFPVRTTPVYHSGISSHRRISNRSTSVWRTGACPGERAPVRRRSAQHHSGREHELPPFSGDPGKTRTCLLHLLLRLRPRGHRHVRRLCSGRSRPGARDRRADRARARPRGPRPVGSSRAEGGDRGRCKAERRVHAPQHPL